MQTLDQERAKFAWDCVKDVSKEYANLAKGAPALVMGNGLMQALAFLHNKGGPAAKLADHVQKWVSRRLGLQKPDFKSFISELVQGDSERLLRATEEALELLRWIRQFASAFGEGGAKG